MGSCFQSVHLSLLYTDAFIGITLVLSSEELQLPTRCYTHTAWWYSHIHLHHTKISKINEMLRENKEYCQKSVELNTFRAVARCQPQ